MVDQFKRRMIQEERRIGLHDGILLINALEEINEVIELHGENCRLDFDYDEDFGLDIKVLVQRIENDEEHNLRLQMQARHAVNARERELAEYQRLKKIFEPNIVENNN